MPSITTVKGQLVVPARRGGACPAPAQHCDPTATPGPAPVHMRVDTSPPVAVPCVPQAMDKWDRLLPLEAKRCVTPGRPCVPCPCPLPASLLVAQPPPASTAVQQQHPPRGSTAAALSLPPPPPLRQSRHEFVMQALQAYEATLDTAALVAQLQRRPEVWRVMQDSFAELLEGTTTVADGGRQNGGGPAAASGGGVLGSKSASSPTSDGTAPPPLREPRSAISLNLADDTALSRFFASGSQGGCTAARHPAKGAAAEGGAPARHAAPSRRRRPGSSRSSCGGGSSVASSVVRITAAPSCAASSSCSGVLPSAK